MDTTRDVLLNTLLLQKGRNPDFPLSPQLSRVPRQRKTYLDGVSCVRDVS